MVYGYVFAAVMYPHVHYTRVILGLTHSISNVAAALCMLYPKAAYALVRI